MFRLINIISCTTSLLAVLWSVNVNAQSSIIGPNSVVAPGTYEYTVNDGVVYTNAYWEVNNNATVVSTYVNGLTYGASIYFNGTGSFVISFINETTLLGTTNVAASCGGDFTPNATFTYASSCGSSIITVGGAPPFGQNWYWQTDPLGISQTTDYSTPFSVTAAGIYYLRPALSSGCWGTALATAPVTIYPLPTVLASNQSICSNQSTSINLSNPNGGPTTFSWIVSAPGVTGASAGSGSTIAQQLSIGGNSMSTVTYTVTATVNGCSGNPSVVYVVVKPRPTASAPNQTLCSEQSTSIAITNPNNIASTTYTWTAAPTGVMGSNGGSGSTIAQSLSSTTGGTVTYSITPSANGCVGSPINVVATVNPLPSAPSVAARNRFDAGPFTITATGAPAGGTYNWYSPSNSLLQGNSATYVTPAVSASTSNYAYAKTVSSAGCLSSGSTWASLNMEAAPIISAPSNRVALAFAVNLDAGAGYVTYDWRNSSNVTVGSAQTLSANTPGNYTVRVTKSNVDGTGVSSAVSVLPQLEGLNENYIITNTIQVNNITDPAQIPNLPVERNSQSIQYFAGLGRPMQTVGTQASPAKKDVVQSMVYDAFGRENKKYLPVITNTIDGWYKTGLIDASGNYVNNATFTNPYSNGLADKIADDSRPFSETVFEPSPLNRPDKDFGTGLDWYTNNKAVQHAYLVNVHGTAAGQEQVIAWKIDAASGLPIRETAVNTSVSGGYYTTGQLSIKSTKDEQGNEVREYTDKEGRVILKKVQAVTTPVLNTAAHWAATYYIYDDLGNLRYVLQPELSKTLLGSSTVNPTQQQLDNLAFQYKYDARRRMSEKKVPGAGWVFMVYDLRDRLVLTQDGNQRAGATNAIKYWTFTKYDELNRPILTGIKDTTTTVQLTQAQMQAAVNAHFAKASARWGETYVGNAAGNLHGYTNRAYPVITSGTTTRDPDRYLTVTYYDNYNFKSLWVGNYNYLNENLSEVANGIIYSQPATESSMTLGLTTGSKTKVLDGGVAGGFTWLEAVTYYDDKGRPVQTVSDNYKGGIDRTTTVLDFVGKALETKTTHNESDVTWKDQVGVSVTGNRLTRTATTTAGAASTQVLPAGQNGWLEVFVSETTTNRYIGFNDTNPDVNATNIDYALYLNGTTLKVVENNVVKLTQTSVLVAGDVLRIERNGTAVRYFRNGVQLSYQNTAALSSALMVDVSLQSNNATIVGVRTSFGGSGRTVTKRMIFDHANRLLRTYHQVDNNAEVLLSQSEYNELGQLVAKKLHSTDNGATFKQVVDRRYNIRGWLTRINNSDLTPDNVSDPRDYFGLNLTYNEVVPGLNNNAEYNGNVSSARWSNNQGLSDIKERAYKFTHDPMNRLLAASHQEKISAWNASTSFNENNLSYDLNGNIFTLSRNGAGGSLMDNLTYTYTGNLLKKVTDTGDAVKGFADGVNTATEYTYDANANLVTDPNRGVSGITYNHLNLVQKATKTTGDYILFTYDAKGNKLGEGEYTSAGALTKKTDYAGEFYYENDTLKFIAHNEGRVVMTGAQPEYQYHLKDHLKNVRATFTTKVDSDISTATLETAVAAAEQSKFLRYANARRINATLFDHTRNGTSSYSQRLNGSANEKTGLAKSISVMPGDSIKMEVFVKYVDSNSSNWTAALATLMSQIASGTAGVVVDGAGYSSSTATFPYAVGLNGTTGSSGVGPKAYMNWLIFDRNFVFKNGGYVRMSAAAKEQGQNVAHEKLTAAFTINEPGYVYVYLSNEETTPLEVYFDDWKVTQVKSPVIETTDYMPFGLTFNSYRREGSQLNRYKFQGQEQVSAFNLGWTQFKYRNGLSDLGRFFNNDPLAEKYYYNSTQAFSENKVTSHVELEGLESWSIQYSDGTNGQVRGPFANQTAAENHADDRLIMTPIPNPQATSEVNPDRMHPTLHIRRPHNGIDLVNSRGGTQGTPIVAPLNGKVTVKGYQNPGAGNYVQIKANKDGKLHNFFHLENGSTDNLQVNQNIQRGQQIGTAGETGGISSGAHLHYEVRGANGEVLQPRNENPTIQNGEQNKTVMPAFDFRLVLERWMNGQNNSNNNNNANNGSNN